MVAPQYGTLQLRPPEKLKSEVVLIQTKTLFHSHSKIVAPYLSTFSLLHSQYPLTMTVLLSMIARLLLRLDPNYFIFLLFRPSGLYIVAQAVYTSYNCNFHLRMPNHG
jgi:hypothetical protein